MSTGVIHSPDRWPARLAFLVLLLYWMALVTGTHLPSSEESLGPRINDKLLHFTAYAVLATLGYSWLRLRGVAELRAVWIVWWVVAVHAGVDEWTQQLVAGRTMDARDALADLAGAAAALGFCFGAERAARRREKPSN